MTLIEYRLTADALCMGEVVKGGLIRPCCRTIRYSAITGALRRHFGSPELHACGYLEGSDAGHNRLDSLVYSPQDRAAGISKVPLEIEFLTDVLGRVFVAGNDAGTRLPAEFRLSLGAMLSKGLGGCHLTRKAVHDAPGVGHGVLRTRIPVKHLSLFGIKKSLTPIYGYLYEPASADPMGPGQYVLSLFEGSAVVGPELLVERRSSG